ncbi:MAG: hypothetical protein ABSC06_40375, partial [Rhodopila sp.]
MSVLEFRPRRWQIVISWLLFAVCLVLAAWLGRKGHDTFWWVLAHDAVQALGTAALVVGGGATLLSILVSRRWTSELQVIAVDLLDETIHHVGVLSQLAAYVLFGRSGSLGELDHAFKLPWTFVDDTKVDDAKRELQGLYDVVNKNDAEIVARLQEVSAELADRGSKLRDAAVGLDSCINDPKPVIPLLAAVAELNRKIRLLIDEAPSPGSLLPPTPAQISFSAYRVLIESVTVARFIHAPFQQIRGDLRDTTLTEQLNDQEDRLKMTAGFERAIRDMQALAKAWERIKIERDAMVERANKDAIRAKEMAADLAADAENKDLTDSDKEIAKEISAKFDIIAGMFSETQRILSEWVPPALLLDEQGDVEGTRAAYRQAIDSGHPDVAPAAALSLG